jgi:hypothetical protein
MQPSPLLPTGVGKANTLGVPAITDRIKARITQIEEQLKQHSDLSGEPERRRVPERRGPTSGR